MNEEIPMIKKNQTWELTTNTKGKNVIGVKWDNRTKLNINGSIFKHKDRLVVKGFVQMAGVDYGDTFAPMAGLYTIRMLLAFTTKNRWSVFHLDVKFSLLNGILEEEITNLKGFKIKGHKDKVYRLKKALYGLKKTLRVWY